jgi:hypothetical protein
MACVVHIQRWSRIPQCAFHPPRQMHAQIQIHSQIQFQDLTSLLTWSAVVVTLLLKHGPCTKLVLQA